MIKELKKAATYLEGKVRVGVINCDKNKELCMERRIPAFPSL